jgi:hypothetical protein
VAIDAHKLGRKSSFSPASGRASIRWKPETIVKDRRDEWKIRGSGRGLTEISAVEDGCGIGRLKRNQQPLFRWESPGFVNLVS